MTKSVKFTALILAACGLSQAEGSVSWQQVGGSLQVDPGLKGIVGQGYTTPVLDDGTTTVQGGFLAHPLLVNNGPFVVSNLPDLTKAEGFAAMTVNLDTVFADFEGPLSYAVSVTGPSATADVSGSTLTLSGSKGVSGTATVVVSATDGTYSITNTFTVTAEASVGIKNRPVKTPVVRDLAVGLPRIFASQVMGAGQGVLGTGKAQDEVSSLSVNLLLPAAGTVSVHIFDQIGTPVIALDRTVSADELARLEPSGDGRRVLPVTWNLRAQNGAAVGAGVYLWKIEMKTVDGQKLESVKRLGVKGVK